MADSFLCGPRSSATPSLLLLFDLAIVGSPCTSTLASDICLLCEFGRRSQVTQMVAVEVSAESRVVDKALGGLSVGLITRLELSVLFPPKRCHTGSPYAPL